MTVLTPGSGRAEAIKDWHARTVRHFAIGTPDIDVPTYDRTRNLFYSGGFGCTCSSAEELYCAEYNRTVGWLVEKYGIPDWAPVKRLPTAHSLLECLKVSGVPFETYSPESPEERNMVDFVLYYWRGVIPTLLTRLRQTSLLVLGGEISEGIGRVDVIDTLIDIRWMASYLFPQEEYFLQPWNPVLVQQSGV